MQKYEIWLEMLKMLSWLSADSSNRAFILGVLTAAALAGAYIFWGPNRTGRQKTRKGKIPGLLNLGRSCFVNAVLQGMASSPTIVKWLGVLNTKHDQQRPGEDNVTLISALYRILRVLNCQGSDCNNDNASAEEVLHSLRRNRWAISDEEQDAHEMFHVLTTTIEEELQKEVALPSLADAARLDDEQPLNSTRCLSKCCVNLPTLKRKELQCNIPYRGLLASQLRCKKCLYTSPIKFDTFDSLSLSIPSSRWPELTLRDCLRHFMMPEQVQDVECEKCCAQQAAANDDEVDLANTRSTSVKRLTIGKLPEVLCIHIQRMTWLNNGMPMKQYRHIAFSEYLDMSEFVYSHRPGNGGRGGASLTSGLIGGSAVSSRTSLSNGTGGLPIAPLSPIVTPLEFNQNNSNSTVSPLIKTASSGHCNLFCLQTVIVHLGDVHSGHFMTYRRGALQSRYRNRWFLCSDTTVQEVPVKEVFNCSAYMLLYERINGGIHRLST